MDGSHRNDPCPCGSGKKFKRCCGSPPPPDSAYGRIRRLEAEANTLLGEFGHACYGVEALERAWGAFLPSEEVPLDDSHDELSLFTTWFMLDWRPEGRERLVERFLRERGGAIDQELRTFLQACIDAPYSFHQTLSCEPGSGLTVRDVMRNRTFRVTERGASASLLKAWIIYARVVELNGISFLMGSGSQALPFDVLPLLQTLRGILAGKRVRKPVELPTEVLLQREPELRQAYLDIVGELRTRKTEIRNTDGDPLLFHTLRFRISSFRSAFDALKSLELSVGGTNESDLIEQARPPRARIHWLKKKRGRESEIITVAMLEVSESILKVETNSARRASKVRREIEKRLGEGAVYLGTEIASTEGMLERATQPGDEPPEAGEAEHERIMKEVPGAAELLRELMRKHWAEWPDTPLPALRGMTPRKAARDPLGRELLESVLLEFEAHNGARDDPSRFVDTQVLRREVGLL
jgi:hypothetical protein